MKLSGVKFRFVFLFLFFFMLVCTYNVDATVKIKSATVEEFVDSLGSISEMLSIQEMQEFMVSVNVVLFMEGLEGGYVKNGGSIKELNKSLDTNEAFFDLIRSTIVVVMQEVTVSFASKEAMQKTIDETIPLLDKVKENSKIEYDVMVDGIKSLDGKSMRNVMKEANSILKRFDLKHSF